LISGVILICQSIGLKAASPWKRATENDMFSNMKYCENLPKKNALLGREVSKLDGSGIALGSLKVSLVRVILRNVCPNTG